VKLKLMAATATLAIATASGAHAQFFDFSNGAYVAGDSASRGEVEVRVHGQQHRLQLLAGRDFAASAPSGYRSTRTSGWSWKAATARAT
jgi:hypothetical protein